jgi:hypothetical protein
MNVIPIILAQRYFKWKIFELQSWRPRRGLQVFIENDLHLSSYEIAMIFLNDVELPSFETTFWTGDFFSKNHRMRPRYKAYHCFILWLRVSFQILLDLIIIV